MISINYYKIDAYFSTGKFLTDNTNSTHVTFPLEYLKEVNATLPPEYFNYTIYIKAYNDLGRRSSSTSKAFGMKIS